MIFDCNGRQLDLRRPRVMGILNVTPDSFSDGGRFLRREDAVRQALAMEAAGAALVDVGGESTRPGAPEVGLDEELARVIPVIEALQEVLEVPISVDTSKPEVMREAVAAGAGMINDVNALRAEGAIEAAAELGVPVCLMHMQGTPRTMQRSPAYDDVVAEVKAFFEARMAACEAAGIPRERLLLDPGFGFGKTLEHNLALLRHLDAFTALDRPLLVGISRKSMLGAITGRETDERLAAGLAAAVLAVERGARLVRVHDVAATVDALKVTMAVMEGEET
ncbi:MAG TPA: dihydropteroate synthase [Rhodospirillales bacterium]|nr:dihydropteroate synthase [Rhodospirillales bacterium]